MIKKTRFDFGFTVEDVLTLDLIKNVQGLEAE